MRKIPEQDENPPEISPLGKSPLPRVRVRVTISVM